jgi:hypothetical protein
MSLLPRKLLAGRAPLTVAFRVNLVTSPFRVIF